MDFQVLGPLQVLRDGQVVALGSAPKVKLVLALLLSQADRVVSADWLVDAVWGDRAPASARQNLSLYVHRLRRALGPERIHRSGAGYRVMPEDNLDLVRFRSLLADGRNALAAGDIPGAGRTLRQSLDLWRGPAYEEFGDCLPLAEESEHLERLRLSAYEHWADAELQLGRAAELASELTGLVRTHPFREKLVGQCMLALYRSGRQAEALEMYREVTASFVDQLGIEPGLDLRQLHEAILLADPSLLARPGAALAGSVRVARAGNPYQGLAAFQQEDAALFFGRDTVLNRLADLTARRSVIAVVGASGSGKSSLLRAGLLGSVAPEGALITPTAQPLQAFARIAGQPGVIVVDQFEEVFTLCSDEAERQEFVTALIEASREPKAVLVLGIRADMLGQVSRYGELVEAIAGEGTLLLGPPTVFELREMVTRPAAAVGLVVEPELLAAALTDTGTEPGALPLLSHALRETWRRSADGELTLAGYRAIGGVRGAIAQSAEQLYHGLTEPEQRAVRRIFLRLTALGDGGEDSRRPVTRAELDGIGDPDVVERVLDRLAAARLVVLDTRTVEVAHEVLIRSWPRLHGWLTADRADLIVHHRLTQAAQHWLALQRDSGALYRDAPLQTTLSWADEHPNELNRLERQFLLASEARQRAERTVERRRIRQLRRMLVALTVLVLLAAGGTVVALDQSQAAELARSAAQARQLALTAQSMVGTDPDLAGLLAVSAYQESPDPRTLSALVSTAASARWHQVFKPDGRQVFAMRFSVDGRHLVTGDDQGYVSVWEAKTGKLLAQYGEHRRLEPSKVPPTVLQAAFDADGRTLVTLAEGMSAIGILIVRDMPSGTVRFQREVGQRMRTMALSPDGTRIAVGDVEGRVRVIDLRGGPDLTFRYADGRVAALAFSPDGTHLFAAIRHTGVVVWDLATKTSRLAIEDDRVGAAAFDDTGRLLVIARQHDVEFWSVSGDRVRKARTLPYQEPWAWSMSAVTAGRLAVADENGLITVWDTERGMPLETYQDRRRAEALVVALSPDGRTLASSGLNGPIVVRDLGDAFAGHTGRVNDLDVSPDRRTVATASGDGSVRLWDTGGRLLRVLDGHADSVEAVAFSPDGRSLAAVTRDHEVTVWNLADGGEDALIRYDASGSSTDVAFRPDAPNEVVTAALGRWRMDLGKPGKPTAAAFGNEYQLANSLEFSPDGAFLYSASADDVVIRHDMRTGEDRRLLRTGQGGLTDIAVSSDGRTIATAGGTTVRLWDAATGAHRATLTGHTAPVLSVAFSPDDRTVAAGGESRTIIVWDARTTREIVTLTGHDTRVQALAFVSPDTLISGANENRVLTWRLDAATAVGRICASTPRRLTAEEIALYSATEVC
ncbi:nSTAND1 domain-containing NTPase [Acrocarpospora phusangensis]|uniref:nSTAND1 domain-containing NTPase n=1 Tax=Acrocarpospora phusangensis TaxID=1070424 RepID=UPI00194DFB89|nr:BTAD domain-containing putative transcriptional regulator [Acrocarpospora phusangensis]